MNTLLLYYTEKNVTNTSLHSQRETNKQQLKTETHKKQNQTQLSQQICLVLIQRAKLSVLTWKQQKPKI